MQKEHRDAIQKNFSSLVEQTDLDLMVAALYEKGVFSDPMIEPYKDITRDARTRKRQLYRDITRRGPEAFRNLLDALSENGYWDLVRDLDPDSALHARASRPPPNPTGASSFLSLHEKKKNTGKEQNDPNRNKAGQTTSPSSSRSSMEWRNSLTESELSGDVTPLASPPSVDPPQPSTPGRTPALPNFTVLKSTKFYENEGKDIQLYRTRGRSRGVLVLFSYISFLHGLEEYRSGAQVDVDNLRYLFSELGFKVLSYIDLTLEATKDTLRELKNGMCGEGPETVFLVFSSHGYARAQGGDTDIRCHDGGLISFYDIIDYFNNVNFPALNGVPKVFIFQTCRGPNKDYTTRASQHLPQPPMPATAPPLATKARPLPAGGVAHDGHAYHDDDDAPATEDPRDRTYSDILIAHSTVPGYVSQRDPSRGSWYFQALCDVFAKRAHDCHVEKLFTLVDQLLQKQFRTQTSSVDRWGFNRRLYLHPGLYED